MSLRQSMKDIADAIREKTGKTDTMTIGEMPLEISSISGGGDESINYLLTTLKTKISPWSASVSGTLTGSQDIPSGITAVELENNGVTLGSSGVRLWVNTSTDATAYPASRIEEIVSQFNSFMEGYIVKPSLQSNFFILGNTSTTSGPIYDWPTHNVWLRITGLDTGTSTSSADNLCSFYEYYYESDGSGRLKTHMGLYCPATQTIPRQACKFALQNVLLPNTTYAFNMASSSSNNNLILNNNNYLLDIAYVTRTTNGYNGSYYLIQNGQSLHDLVIRSNQQPYDKFVQSASDGSQRIFKPECYRAFGTVNADYNPNGEYMNIWINDEVLDAYKAAPGWSAFSSLMKPLSEYVPVEYPEDFTTN